VVRTVTSSRRQGALKAPAAFAGGIALAFCAASCSDATSTGSAGQTPAGPRGPVSVGTFTGVTAETTSTFRIDANTWTIHYSTSAQNCNGLSALVLVFDASHPDAFVRNIPIQGCVDGSVTIPFGPSNFFLKVSVSSAQVSYSIAVSEVR